MIGLRKRPFAYTDPLVRGFISLGEKEAQQEQKYSTIKHWPSTQMIMFDFREASLNCVVWTKMTAKDINENGRFSGLHVKSAGEAHVVPNCSSQVVMCLISVVIAIDTILKAHHKYWPPSTCAGLHYKNFFFQICQCTHVWCLVDNCEWV